MEAKSVGLIGLTKRIGRATTDTEWATGVSSYRHRILFHRKIYLFCSTSTAESSRFWMASQCQINLNDEKNLKTNKIRQNDWAICISRCTKWRGHLHEIWTKEFIVMTAKSPDVYRHYNVSAKSLKGVTKVY